MPVRACYNVDAESAPDSQLARALKGLRCSGRMAVGRGRVGEPDWLEPERPEHRTLVERRAVC